MASATSKSCGSSSNRDHHVTVSVRSYGPSVDTKTTPGHSSEFTLSISRERKRRRSRQGQEPTVTGTAPTAAASSPPPIEIVDVDAAVEFPSTPISARGSTKSTAISVEQYAEERDIHLATLASLAVSSDDDDVQILEPVAFRNPFGKKPFSGHPVTEVGQSSQSGADCSIVKFVCAICVEPKDVGDSFRVQGCTHSYCTECISRYVGSKLHENISSIKCPVVECNGWLEPEQCRSILPKDVFDRWGNALCEAVILGLGNFYCPFKDCSAPLINDVHEVVRESECPNCYRLFCAQCKVPWHAGISCEEFQRLNEDERGSEDIMLMKLAQNMKWTRCPRRRFYVEKQSGCMFVRCRCGVEFCYRCGTPPNTSHYCSKCCR